jgi:hypothetical protein
MGRIVYTNGSFLSFGLKNDLIEFLKAMDWILVGLGFAKCYIDDIIIFSLTLGNNIHHL